MTSSRLDEDSCRAGDDHWIFEQLGSPGKPRSLSSSNNGDTVNQIRKSFDEKLRIYADNMRKLIITARKQINDLKLENTSLKHKLKASGLIECPACLFHFKPEREHCVLPKYIKVFRGKLSIEIEFNSLEEMSEWLTVNRLDENADGLPTMMQNEDQEVNLASTGSLIYKLMKEKQEAEAKKKKVVINIRPRDKCPSTVGSSTATGRCPLRKRVITSMAPSALSKASGSEYLGNKCSEDRNKEGAEGSFTSSQLSSTSSGSNHNQEKAHFDVKHSRNSGLHEEDKHKDLAAHVGKCYSGPFFDISGSGMHGQDGKFDDNEESFREGCSDELRKNLSAPSAQSLHNATKKDITEFQKSRASDFVKSSEGMLNKNVARMSKEEMKMEPRRMVLVKEDVSGGSARNDVEACNRVIVQETNCKRNTDVKLEKYSATSPSPSLSKSRRDGYFSDKDHKDDVERRRFSEKINRNEGSNDFKDPKTSEGRSRLNEHQDENGKIDMESHRRSKKDSELASHRNHSRSSCQRDDTCDIHREDYHSHETKKERCSTGGSSRGTYTSSRISRSTHSRTSSCGVVDEGIRKDRISPDRKSSRRSVERVDHQKHVSKHHRNHNSAKDFKHKNSKRSTGLKNQNVLRSSVGSKANTVSPLRSPRIKRRKLSKSPPRLENEDADSAESDGDSLSSNDLIVIDEEEVEDGEIVE